MKIHYEKCFDGYKTVSICGICVEVDDDEITLNIDKVTCKSCLKILVAKGKKAWRGLRKLKR